MRYQYQSGEQVYQVSIEREGDGYLVLVDGKPHPIEVLDAQPGLVSLRFDGKPVTVYWAARGGEKWLAINGCTYRLEKPRPRAQRSGGDPGGETIRAPMPAQVRAVQAAEGDAVEKGQTLLLLEAMKMEIRIKAPAKGILKRLLVSAGQAVEKEQVLAQIEGAPVPQPPG